MRNLNLTTQGKDKYLIGIPCIVVCLLDLPKEGKLAREAISSSREGLLSCFLGRLPTASTGKDVMLHALQ
jgi:hypothetical protein